MTFADRLSSSPSRRVPRRPASRRGMELRPTPCRRCSCGCADLRRHRARGGQLRGARPLDGRLRRRRPLLLCGASEPAQRRAFLVRGAAGAHVARRGCSRFALNRTFPAACCVHSALLWAAILSFSRPREKMRQTDRQTDER